MTVRIANAQGFWGDAQDAPRRMLSTGDFDYLTLDYLAEVTMAVLSRQQNKNPEKGFATDFPPLVEDILEESMSRDIPIITNAGGINPEACRDEILSISRGLGLEPAVATVSGDDFRDKVDEFDAQDLRHAYSDQPLPPDKDVVSANAYFGAFPIADALEDGADVVVTGRVVDAALALGPLVFEHGWTYDQYDRLARGLIAGHIIECGSQATGGNFLGAWEEIEFETIGFPIAAVDEAGKIEITKPSETGGRVSRETISEQLLYEVGDPENYHSPDVIADFSDVRMNEVEPDRVEIRGIRGKPPTDRYKASLHYQDGWLINSSIVYSNPDASDKAGRAAAYLESRAETAGIDCRRFNSELVGAGALHDREFDAEEVVLRVAIETATREEASKFGTLVAPLGLGGPPAITLFNTGRPRPRPKLAYHPVLVPKREFDPKVEVVEA